jgi:hypothetical protein
MIIKKKKFRKKIEDDVLLAKNKLRCSKKEQIEICYQERTN